MSVSTEENNKLQDEIKALKKEIEKLTRENEAKEERFTVLQSSRNKLQNDQDMLTTAINQLQIQVEQKNAKDKEEKQILWQNVQALHSDLQHIKAKPVLGQVAWLLEKEIWKAVLPNKKMGYTGILRSMKQWLRRNSNNPEGREAQNRWDELKANLNWNEDDHMYGLKMLKAVRNVEAHPMEVDLDEARRELRENSYVADTDMRICEEIIDMVITARELNMQ